MKNATHLKLTQELRFAAKIQAVLTGRTLSEYVSDLIAADTVELRNGTSVSPNADVLTATADAANDGK